MEIKDFRKLLKKEFRPRLDVLGFKGTDHHFIKKTNNHFVYTLVIQANKYGGSCIMEMGVTLDFLFNEALNSKLTVYDCEFRKRLHPNHTILERLTGNIIERWHEYGKDEKEALKTINNMCKLFEEKGIPYYDQFHEFPNCIIDITLNEIISGSKRLYNLGSPPKIRLALLIARAHKFLGNNDECKSFTQWGLDNIGNATGLIKDFRMLIQEE